MLERLPLFAAALWWGSLSAIGFMAVPLGFATLPSCALAGHLGAVLFAAQTWVSLACGLVLLLGLKKNVAAAGAGKAQGAIILVVLGLLLAVLLQYGVAPRIVARVNLALWHGVGTALYVLQWLCAGALLWRLSGRPKEQADELTHR